MSILIDFDNVIGTRELMLLKKRLGPPPETNRQIGVVLVVRDTIIENLKSYKTGHERVNYMNTPVFVNSIENKGYIVFDIKKKRCDIPISSIHLLGEVIENTMRYLPNNLVLYCDVDVNDNTSVSILTRHGFGGTNISDSVMEMSRLNDIIIDKQNSKEETLFMVENNRRINCSYKARLSDKAVKYLQRLPERGVTVTDGKFSQKEIAGSLITGKIDSRRVHHLEIRDYKTSSNTEKIKIEPSMVTFHTHPIEAYQRNNVSVGWPSRTDYISFLRVADRMNLVMHIVIALEGFYIISRNPEWIDSNNKFTDAIERSIVNSNAFDKRGRHNGRWHVTEINKITVNNIHILKVLLVPWANAASTVFEVVYNKENQNCIIPK